MVDYTADDGLKVLNYLGITNITDTERVVFREKWDKFYRDHDQDLIGTTWVLYAEALPFIVGDGDRGSFMIAQLRDSDFGERLKIRRLDEELKQGFPLEEILKKWSHKLYKQLN